MSNIHTSVGAIIKNEKNEILLIDRVKIPLGWAGPAGHVDKGESPEDALIREVKEETNLNIKKFKLLFHEFIAWNKCSGGTMGHDWFLYKVIGWDGEVKKEDREAKDIRWVSPEEIKELKLEEVWQYWFKKLGYKI